MVQKVTGVIYLSAPIVFLSLSPAGGTVLASVYAVYNNVFNMIKSLLRGVIDAPRLGIGQMLSETDHERIWNVFAEYEYIVLGFTFVICSTTYVLIMPFVSMYTSGMSDVNYYDKTIALLMSLISVFEIIHIPSGHLINMSGEFRTSKYIQIISLTVLVPCMLILGRLWGVYGLLYAVLIVAILLAILEIGFIHMYFFKNKVIEFVKMLLPLLLAGIGICYHEKKVFTNIESIKIFILYGMLITLINTIAAVIIGMVFNKKLIFKVYQRVLRLIRHKGV
jgi:O-antigen/teichoic acid export membrane protein